jgi:hypothetical protein
MEKVDSVKINKTSSHFLGLSRWKRRSVGSILGISRANQPLGKGQSPVKEVEPFRRGRAIDQRLLPVASRRMASRNPG